ncbi:MAG TPA: M48 family metallopeptidase [Humisphaera sp.]|jgi:Zn-dependent protease with chaperone function|nr:M48 family metallopeptidase [Humisphaera sp.]
MARNDRSVRERLNLLEHEAAAHPRKHAARLVALALFGYLYPTALALVAFGGVVAMLSLAPLTFQSDDFRIIFLYIAGLLVALILSAAVISTFWVKLPKPGGCRLGAGEASLLRQMIEDLRAAQGAPPVHQIILEPELNAAVLQRQRFGFWGPSTNYLAIGLPLLIALTRDQLRAVLAHELLHLRSRHSRFSAWMYRIHQTWMLMAAPFNAAGKVRHIVMGWFVNWYGGYFAISTLALRRKHEYAADAGSAATLGPQHAAAALISLSLAEYRFNREFYPALLRLGNDDPIPPSDYLDRVRALLATPMPPQMLRRWQAREASSLTPITSAHPCLADRLAAIGCRDLLESADRRVTLLPTAGQIDPSASAVSLLGDSQARIWATMNAAWKSQVIGRWRMENAIALDWAQKLAKSQAEAALSTAEPTAERQWERVRIEIEGVPNNESMRMLESFLETHGTHAAANFTLARLLLNEDEEQRAVEHFERSMKHDSEYITPSLHILLDYYRDAGRDRDADPIRQRLEEHERILTAARKERLKVNRRDRFLPHDLPADDLEKVRRVLHRLPQVTAGYLARKQVRLLADKPGYVLGIKRRASLLDERRKADKRLTEYLSSALEVPCAVVILSRASFGVRSRLLKACPSPVFFASEQ